MIRVFYGDDRVKTSLEAKRVLGEGYEVIDGTELKYEDLASVFLGASLFAEKRRILIKDVGENSDKRVMEKLVEYVGTEHEVVIWESKLDKRLTAVKKLLKAGVEDREFRSIKKEDPREVFKLLEVALRDGGAAVKVLKKMEKEQAEPYMVFGALAASAITRYTRRQGEKEKRVLKELSVIDKQMKSTNVMPWLLLESFLRRVSSL